VLENALLVRFPESPVRHITGLAPRESIACAFASPTPPSMAALPGWFQQPAKALSKGLRVIGLSLDPHSWTMHDESGEHSNAMAPSGKSHDFRPSHAGAAAAMLGDSLRREHRHVAPQ
jgi:hypothetical protein